MSRFRSFPSSDLPPSDLHVDRSSFFEPVSFSFAVEKFSVGPFPTHFFPSPIEHGNRDLRHIEETLVKAYGRLHATEVLSFGFQLGAVLVAFYEAFSRIPWYTVEACIERTRFNSYADVPRYAWNEEGGVRNPLRQFAIIRYLATTEENSHLPRWLRNFLKYLSAPSFAYYTTVVEVPDSGHVRGVFDVWRDGALPATIRTARGDRAVGFPVDYSGRTGYCPAPFRPSVFSSFDLRRVAVERRIAAGSAVQSAAARDSSARSSGSGV